MSNDNDGFVDDPRTDEYSTAGEDAQGLAATDESGLAQEDGGDSLDERIPDQEEFQVARQFIRQMAYQGILPMSDHYNAYIKT